MNLFDFIIIPNLSKDPETGIARKIEAFLEQKGAKVRYLRHIHYQNQPGEQKAFEGIDPKKILSRAAEVENPWNTMAIVLGGDGTLLSSSRMLYGFNIPILGINLGHVGFLTACEQSEAFALLEDVLAGEFQISERSMLEGEIVRNGVVREKFVAMNDIVLIRGSFSRMVAVEVNLNHQHLGIVNGDGVLFSTPTGSTGYNLSAGGPILMPQNKNLVMTPVCSRMNISQSVVSGKDDTFTFRVLDEDISDVALTVDGQDAYAITHEDVIKASVSEYSTFLIHRKENTFCDTLRTKLFKD